MKRKNFYEDVLLHEQLKKWIAPWALNYEYSKKIPATKISGLPDISSGLNGKNGDSAYDIAVKNGFVGTQAMWLASLKGDPGVDGSKGSDGVAGQNGSHYVFIYKNASEKPNFPYSGMTIDNLQDGWTQYPVNPDFSKNEYTWMSQCEISGNGTYGGWTIPIRITGLEGKTGEDGSDIEFIYTRNNTGETPATPISPQIDDWSGLSNGIVWSDNPQGVQPYLMYEFVSVRTKKKGVWGEYSTPVIWAKWGEKGQDGDGFEYIYKLSPTKPETPQSVNLDDNIPEGWNDEPLDVSESDPYEWVCVRKKTRDLWGEYNDPILWTRWAPKGKDGGQYIDLYKNSSNTPEIPNGSSSYSVDTLISEGWQRTPTAPDFENEEYTYMTQAFFSDGQESAIWSIPVRTTGDFGKPGEDGTRTEFIYKSFTTIQNWDSSDNNPHNWGVQQQKDYFGPEGFEWSDNPTGVNSTNKYEYVAQRTYDGQTWSQFTIPVIWSHWGRDGRDGDGYEYIYKRFTSAQTFSNNNNNPEYWEASQEEDYLGPTGYKWADDPTGVDSTYKFEYVSTRKKSDEIWGKFSTPVLWANWSKDGATPEIKGDGYWYINGVSTGVKAKGENGDSPYIGSDGYWWIGTEKTEWMATAQSSLHLDLSNQMDAMGLTHEGVVINTQTFETVITQYSGSSTVPLTGITYSSVPSGVTVTTNASTGKVTVEILSGTTLENDKLNLTLTASSSLGNMSGIFTIIGIRAGEQGEQGNTGEGGSGESPIIYQLVPSENVIKKDKNNNYTPNTITCGIVKRDGSSAPVTYSGSAATIKMIIDDGSEQDYQSISTSSVSLKVIYRLYQNGVLVDVETVPVIEDGEDGDSVTMTDHYVKYAITENSTKPSESDFIYTEMPTVEDGKYLWVWTHEEYSNGVENDSYSVGRVGIDGHGVKGSIVTYCQKEDTNIAPENFASSDWGDYPTDLNQGWWLYTRTIVTYSDNTKAISYSSSQIGTGSHYAGVVEYYALGTSDNTAPTGAPNAGTYTSGQSISIGSSWNQGSRPATNPTTPYIWNFEISSDSGGNRYVTTPICIGNWSKGIEAIIELYAISAYATPQSGHDYPTDISSWSDEQQNAAPTEDKRYQWNKTIVAYNSSTHDSSSDTWDDSTCDVHYHVSAVKGTDGYTITINPSPVVLQQSADDANDWGVSTSNPLVITINITKGFDNTNLVNSLSSVTSSIVNVTSSANTISITGVKSAALVNGTITATANLLDNTTKDISISVGLLKLASFKQTISGDVLSQVANSFDYNPDGASTAESIIENLGQYIKSSKEMSSQIKTTIGDSTFSSYMTQTSTTWKTGVKSDIEGELSDTGIDITNHVIKLKADNFGIYNNSGTKTFSVDANGNLLSSGNAGFSGKVTATSGTIGGWDISTSGIGIATTSANKLNTIRLNPSTPLILLTSNNTIEDYVMEISPEEGFKIYEDRLNPEGEIRTWLKSDGSGFLGKGNLTWDTLGNVSLTGTINSTSGSIGGWNIDSNGLSSSNKKIQLSHVRNDGNTSTTSTAEISAEEYFVGMSTQKVFTDQQNNTNTYQAVYTSNGLQFAKADWGSNWASSPSGGMIPLQLSVDGSGWLANGALTWDASGTCTMSNSFARSVLNALVNVNGQIMDFGENTLQSRQVSTDTNNEEIEFYCQMWPEQLVLSKSNLTQGEEINLTYLTSEDVYYNGDRATWSNIINAANLGFTKSSSNLINYSGSINITSNLNVGDSIKSPYITGEYGFKTRYSILFVSALDGSTSGDVSISRDGITYDGQTRTWAQIFAAIPNS